jgi:DNA (cytosine-5)-methyltransferase 1
MSRPHLLDLFSGAGGAAVGYHRAGFEVTGVDIALQPRYPFRFIQADALEFLASVKPGEWDVIHASPPCQKHTTLAALQSREYPDYIAAVRAELERIGGVWVIENVEGAPLRSPVRLCGSSFGLGVWRHRLFEIRPCFVFASDCLHRLAPEPLDVTGTGGPQKGTRRKAGGGRSRKPTDLSEARAAMGMDWGTRREISQAIPPAYTHWIGCQLLTAGFHPETHTPRADEPA